VPDLRSEGQIQCGRNHLIARFQNESDSVIALARSPGTKKSEELTKAVIAAVKRGTSGE
jgi:hypothetical protein